jgi:hypothetical protein
MTNVIHSPKNLPFANSFEVSLSNISSSTSFHTFLVCFAVAGRQICGLILCKTLSIDAQHCSTIYGSSTRVAAS